MPAYLDSARFSPGREQTIALLGRMRSAVLVCECVEVRKRLETTRVRSSDRCM